MQEGKQETLDLIMSQSADGRHGATAHGGTASLQLEQSRTHYTQKKHTVVRCYNSFGGKNILQPDKISPLYLARSKDALFKVIGKILIPGRSLFLLSKIQTNNVVVS